jgi:tetratricopeptide (TPR) repeat protein
MIVAIAFAGCAKKPAEAPEVIQARNLLLEGTVFLKQSDVVKAIQSFAAAIKVAPDYFESYYLLSETLLRLKQYTQAEAILIAAVKKFPDNGVAYYLLAVAHQSAGNMIPAIVAARKSVDLFTIRGDKEGQQRAMILLAALVSEAKKLSAEQAAENAKTETLKAIGTTETAGAADSSVPTEDTAADVQRP